MATDVDPIVGTWYLSQDKRQRFEVVALDEDDGVVEIQHFDGDVEELDLDTWYELDLEPTEAPENWTGPVDEIDRGELTYAASDMQDAEWDEGFEEVRRQREREEDAAAQGDEEERE